ncbi:MAG: hypothetical protein OEY93_03160 [Anaerolineae bacterium]|nr:hypothetical protein [Anaerolineae bacterium]
MNLKTTFTINAIVTVLFGLGFILMPGTLTGMYGVTLSEAGLYVGSLLGATFVGMAVMSWMAKDASESEARRSIVLGLFVGDGIAFILALLGQLNGVVNSLGWLTVALYLFFAVLFGMNYFSSSS